MICTNQRLKYSLVVTILFIVCAICVNNSQQKWKKHKVLTWDKYGYHHYLPALFIYQDLYHYDHLEEIEQNYQPVDSTRKLYGLHQTTLNDNLCNQYSVGVSLFQMPAFFIAHAYCIITGKNLADGYSAPYQHGIVLTTLLFSAIGVFLLMLFLNHFFSPLISTATTLLICFGTNFFHYATIDSGLTHPYQFFLYTCALILSYKWHKTPRFKTSILLGLTIGLAIITRPVDIFICLIPLLWKGNQKDKWQMMKEEWKKVCAVGLCVFLMCTLQMSYWYTITGDVIYYSYGSNDYFQFKKLKLIQGLFSYRKGWFVYTPLALLAFINVWRLARQPRLRFYPFLFWVFFVPMLLLVFSWNNWYYGWSFGCRALIGVLPLLALPLANWLESIHNSESPFRKGRALVILTFIVFLNLFQTWQYHKGMIHGTLMNATAYWKLFLQKERPEDLNLIYTEQSKFDYNTQSEN